MALAGTPPSPFPGPRRRIADHPAWLYLLFAAGFLVFFRNQIFSGFEWNYGDRGDPRLIIFLLESTFRALVKGGDILSPPFFFDWTGTLGYSDALLLFQVPYAPARLLGADPYLAMQIAPMVLALLGLATAYALFRRLGAPVVAAAAGAVIFCFPISLYGAVAHPQLFALYLIPLVPLCLLAGLMDLPRWPRRAYLLAGTAGLVFGLTFATGYYIAWSYQLQAGIFTVLFAALAGRQTAAFLRANAYRMLGFVAAYTGALLVALVPFALIYIPVLRRGNAWGVEQYLVYASGLGDIFNFGTSGLVWGDAFVEWGLLSPKRVGAAEAQFMFTPFVLAILFLSLLSVIAWRRLWNGSAEGRLLRVLALAAALTAIVFYALVIEVDGWTLFALVIRYVPGASGIRVGYRGMLTADLFAMAAGVIVVGRLWADVRIAGRGARPVFAGALALLAVAALEQVDLYRTSGMSRSAELALLAAIPPTPTGCRAIYAADQPDQPIPAYIHADAMMVALRDNVPTVEGFSGIFPPGWRLYDTHDAGFETRVIDYADRRHLLAGLCRLDVNARTWRVFRDGADARAFLMQGLKPIATDPDGAVRLDLALTGNAQPFVDGRWWGAEDWGRWAADADAFVTVPVPGDPAEISADVRIIVTPGVPSRRVWLDVNDCRIAAATIELGKGYDAKLAGAIPPGCLRADRLVTIGVHTDKAMSPKELGVNDDTRSLGVGVSRIVLGR